jgi:phosphoglycolate phosphatase
MFSLIVFDLDGTLVDSRKDLAQATNALVGEYGAAPLDEDAVVHMVGEGAAKLIARAFAAAGLGLPPAAALPRFLEIYGGCLLVHTREYPGVPQMLRALSPLARLAVLTNKPRVMSQAILRGLGLGHFFARVVGGDGPAPRKPDPAGLRQLAADFGADASTLLVGDSAIDLRTARAAGAPVALVRYGFGFDDIPRELFDGRELIVNQPHDLIDVVRHERSLGAFEAPEETRGAKGDKGSVEG